MISFILPIRNEVKYIKQTLDSILYQNNINQVVEILIADGMSDDGTREIIKELKSKYPNITLIDNPEKIVSTGFNRALNESKGIIIIRVDGHCEIAPGYIQKCLECLEKINADCVGGATEHVASGLVGESIKIAQSSFFGVGGVLFRKKVEKGQFVDTLAFGAYKRDVFEKIGGYDEELLRNQDDEFNFRLIQNGGKIWLDPSIKSRYYSRTSLFQLFKQYFQYGFYKIRVAQKRKGFSSWRHVVPGCFVFALISSIYLFSVLFIRWPFFLIMGLYVSLNVIFSLYKIYKNHTHLFSIILLPTTFITMHLAYGIGTLIGLISFINTWTDSSLNDTHFDRENFISS